MYCNNRAILPLLFTNAKGNQCIDHDDEWKCQGINLKHDASEHNGGCNKHKAESNAIVFEGEILEFERKHRHFTHQYPARKCDEQYTCCSKNGSGKEGLSVFVEISGQTCPEKRVSRCGKTDETVRLTCVEIKLCQSNSGKCGNGESQIRHHTRWTESGCSAARELELKHVEKHQRRSHTKGHHVCKRV